MEADAITISLGAGGGAGLGAMAGAAGGERLLWSSPTGAGAGMAHRSMAAIADGLAARGAASLRYQFPYMERGSSRVRSAGWWRRRRLRAAVAEARARAGPSPSSPAAARSAAG